ncbi:MAG TPA: hypothetical protein VFQ00_13735 [Terriglobales bacterium]|nr:hypothetical protein [Terriglobales bacterium]
MLRNRCFFVPALLLILGAHLDAQSLGDLARAQQESKQQSGTPATKKVYTNEDLKSGSSSEEAGEPQRQPSADKHQSNEGQPAQQLTPEQWKALIQTQKDKIADLQQKIDKAQARVHYVQSDLYYNGVQHNEREKRYQEQIDRAKSVLDQEKQKLAEMQEAARQAGMGNAVYQ